MSLPEIDWDEVDAWDVGQAHDELEAHVTGLAAENAEVRTFLAIRDEQFETVRIAGAAGAVDLRVVAVVPWGVRTRIAQLATDAKRIARKEAEEWRRAAAGEEIEIPDPDPIAMQRPMYEVLGDLCLDAPWNDWKTWAAIDVRTGSAPDMLERILAKIAPREDRVRSFRPKR